MRNMGKGISSIAFKRSICKLLLNHAVINTRMCSCWLYSMPRCLMIVMRKEPTVPVGINSCSPGDGLVRFTSANTGEDCELIVSLNGLCYAKNHFLWMQSQSADVSVLLTFHCETVSYELGHIVTCLCRAIGGLKQQDIAVSLFPSPH